LIIILFQEIKRPNFIFPCLLSRHFKLAHKLGDQADNIFVEDINFKSRSRGIVRKASLDSGIGQFINEILPFVCWKRGKLYLKVDKDYTSQECPECGHNNGKKQLSERVHKCENCGYTCNRDVAAAKVIENRGKTAVGQPVERKSVRSRSGGAKQLELFDLSCFAS